MISKLFKNFSFLVFSQICTRIISFFYAAVFLPTALGVDGYGLYIVGLSLFSLLASLSDFGLSRYMMREVAQDEAKNKQLFSQILTIRLGIIVLAGIIYALTLIFFDKNIERLYISLLILIALIPQTVVLTLENFYMATGKISLIAKGILIISVTTAIFGIFLVLEGFSVYGAIESLILGYFAGLIFLSFNYKKSYRISKPIVSLEILKQIAKGSLPYAFLGILGLIFFRIDSLMLSYFRGSYETGLYGLAYKFIEAIVFIPAVLAGIIFPIFSRLHNAGETEVKALLGKIGLVMSGIGILVTLGFIFILPPLITVFLPLSYSTSVQVLRILSLTIPFMFLHIPLSQVLLSSEKYLKPIIIISLIDVFFNIGANLIFIPQYGLMAAAWITVLSDMLSLILLLYCIKRFIYRSKLY